MTINAHEVTWGDYLVLAAFKTPGGLNVAVRAIRDVVGTHIGVRNTFSKLLVVRDPNTLSNKDRFRAWLLIVALLQEPEDYGIDDAIVPPAYDIEHLREALRAWRDSNPQPSVPDSPTPDTVVGLGVSPWRPRHDTPAPIRHRRNHVFRNAA